MPRKTKKELEDKLLETIYNNNLIETEDKIVVGVSGGPDSMCLLDNLNKIKLKEKNFQIVVATLNHMIREEAKEEVEYVKKYCEKNNIEFYTKSIDVKKMAHNKKIGDEAAGRLARYEFFDEILEKTKSNKIAVAHNKNDKIETIILHVLRGSGMEGLKGIEPKRDNIIRPLINCDRTEIEEYCEKNCLNPKIDKSNFKNIYQRNKVRNVVIPYVKQEFNPNIIETINRLSEIITEEDKYMEKQTSNAYKSIVIKKEEKQIIIDLKGFNYQETVIKARLIRYIIKELFGNSNSIEKIHIQDIIKLANNNKGNKYLMPNKNLKVLIQNHKIYFTKQI